MTPRSELADSVRRELDSSNYSFFNVSGHFECPPYNQQTIRSAYHVRNIEVFKLKQVSEKSGFFF